MNNRSKGFNNRQGILHKNLTGYTNKSRYRIWYLVTLLFLIFDYSRIAELSGLGPLRLMLVLDILMTCFIFFYCTTSLANNTQIRILWLFIFVLLIFVPFARNNGLAFKTFKAMLLYMPFIYSVIFTVNSIKRLKILITVGIILMIFVSLYSFAHNGRGPGNYMLDENDLSLYLNMWIPFSFFLLLHEKAKVNKIFYFLSLLLGLAAVVVSFSRGGFIGLVVMTAIAWYYTPRKVVSFLLIGILSVFIYLFAGDKYWSEMSTITDNGENTRVERILSWKAAWKIFIDYPLGVGGGNFPVYFPKYQSSEFRHNMWGRVAHSLWFTLLPELGFIGTLIYLTLLYKNLKIVKTVKKSICNTESSHRRYITSLSHAYIASFGGFFASATFLSVLYYAHYWYLTAFIIATANVTSKLCTSEDFSTQ
ncbi:MAG: hypothetical protein GX640_06820 [Fibrobacter sp.]|nr:hypothetical protein [Fibrobacter sp.]